MANKGPASIKSFTVCGRKINIKFIIIFIYRKPDLPRRMVFMSSWLLKGTGTISRRWMAWLPTLTLRMCSSWIGGKTSTLNSGQLWDLSFVTVSIRYISLPCGTKVLGCEFVVSLKKKKILWAIHVHENNLQKLSISTKIDF